MSINQLTEGNADVLGHADTEVAYPRWIRRGAAVLVVLMLVRITTPWAPLSPTSLESDSILISFGVAQLLHDNSVGYQYRYECQSGSYQTIAFMCRALGFAGVRLEPLLLFRVLTILGFLVFAGAAMCFLHDLLGLPRLFCLASLFLMQETYISSYYPNTNMLALPWAMAALAILAHRVNWQRCVLAGVLYGIGVWMRIDLVLLCFVFPVLLKPQTRQAWGQVGVVALVSITVSNALIWFSGVSLPQVLESYKTHAEQFTDLGQTFLMYATIFTLLVVVAFACGVFRFWHKGSWHLLALVLTGSLPIMGAYGLTLTTPKYLLYSLTFVALASSAGLWWLLHSRGYWGRGIVFSLFVVQYLANPFGSFEHPGIVHTHDCTRRIGATMASLSEWHIENKVNVKNTLDVRSRVNDYANKYEKSVLVMQNYTHRYLIPYHLLENGYQVRHANYRQNMGIRYYQRGQSEVAVLNVGLGRKEPIESYELESLGIALPRKFQVLGYLEPKMLPLKGKPKVRGTGKYGTYIMQCRAQTPVKYINHTMLPLKGNLKVGETGKYGTYILQCRAQSPVTTE